MTYQEVIQTYLWRVWSGQVRWLKAESAASFTSGYLRTVNHRCGVLCCCGRQRVMYSTQTKMLLSRRILHRFTNLSVYYKPFNIAMICISFGNYALQHSYGCPGCLAILKAETAIEMFNYYQVFLRPITFLDNLIFCLNDMFCGCGFVYLLARSKELRGCE